MFINSVGPRMDWRDPETLAAALDHQKKAYQAYLLCRELAEMSSSPAFNPWGRPHIKADPLLSQSFWYQPQAADGQDQDYPMRDDYASMMDLSAHQQHQQQNLMSDSSCVSLHKHLGHAQHQHPSSPSQVPPIPSHQDSSGSPYCAWPAGATTPAAAAFSGFATTTSALVPDGLPAPLGLEAGDFASYEPAPAAYTHYYPGFSRHHAANYLTAGPDSLHGSFSSSAVASDMMGSLAIGDKNSDIKNNASSTCSSASSSFNHPGSWSLLSGPADGTAASVAATADFSPPPQPDPIMGGGLVAGPNEVAGSMQPGQGPPPTAAPATPHLGPRRQQREKTVSPKLLRIRPSPTPKSSSESSHQNYLADSSESDSATGYPLPAKQQSLKQQQPPEQQTVVVAPFPAQTASRRGTASTKASRKQLPSRAPAAHRFVPIRPGRNTSTSSSSAKSSSSYRTAENSPTSAPAEITVPAPAPAPLPPPPPPPVPSPRVGNAGAVSGRTRGSRVAGSGKRIRETPARDGGRGDESMEAEFPCLSSYCPPSPSAAAAAAVRERSLKDDFLVRSKLAGMKYKEIRRKGGFTEAESTLRGRFRTLTKHRDARVRRPEWTENDLLLLERAVRTLAEGDDIARARIPWKKVAEYIVDNGGTYLFGNSTCRKRWDELVVKGRVRGVGRGSTRAAEDDDYDDEDDEQ